MTDEQATVRPVFLDGNRLYLRALEERDLGSAYLQWLNDPAVCEFNSHAIFPNTSEHIRAFYQSTRKADDAIVLAVVWKEDDRHIGNVSLQHIDWVARSAEFAVLIGERDFWNRGVTSEAARLLVGYAFERLNLQRVHCGTSELNVGMRRVAEKLGMKEEGRRRRAIYKFGRYSDIIEYGMLREEFEADAAG